MKREIQLFGAFRKYGKDSVDVDVDDQVTVADLRASIKAELPPEAKDLVDDSAFANEFEVLSDAACVGPGRRFAALPPVCGG